MSLQRIQGKVTEQALRSRPAPPKLEFWLNLIEEFPGDQVLNDWEEGPNEEPLDAWNAQLSTLPARAQRFVRDGNPRLNRTNVVATGERYEQLQAAQQVLREIARVKSAQRIELTNRAYLAGLNVGLDGKIGVVLSPICEALQGVEANRIRECENPKCGRVFWAGRSDQPCCSKVCANARRVRRWREAYQSTYKQNRLKREHTTDVISGRTIRKGDK